MPFSNLNENFLKAPDDDAPFRLRGQERQQ
jgi:hypothetical protein